MHLLPRASLPRWCHLLLFNCPLHPCRHPWLPLTRSAPPFSRLHSSNSRQSQPPWPRHLPRAWTGKRTFVPLWQCRERPTSRPRSSLWSLSSLATQSLAGTFQVGRHLSSKKSSSNINQFFLFAGESTVMQVKEDLWRLKDNISVTDLKEPDLYCLKFRGLQGETVELFDEHQLLWVIWRLFLSFLPFFSLP